MRKLLIVFLSLFLTALAPMAERKSQELFTASEPVNTVALLGDSIGAGLFSSAVGESNWIRKLVINLLTFEQNSFVEFHRDALQKMFPEKKWVADNYSIPGATTEDIINEQLPKIIKTDPDIVIVEAFANDICADSIDGMLPVEQYRKNMNFIVDVLLHETDAAIVLVAGIDMPWLYDLMKDERNFLFIKAKKLWKTLETCTTATSGKDQEIVRERIAQYNSVMEDIALAHSDKVCFTYKSRGEKFKKSHVSRIDLFHPSKLGQRYLFDKTFPFETGNCEP